MDDRHDREVMGSRSLNSLRVSEPVDFSCVHCLNDLPGFVPLLRMWNFLCISEYGLRGSILCLFVDRICERFERGFCSGLCHIILRYMSE